jgi:hypothetical protein
MLDAKIQIEPFMDIRADKMKCGENSENQENKVFTPVTTSGCAVGFCTQNFGNALGQFGFSVVPELDEVVFGGQILEFMVAETKPQEGELRLQLTLEKHGQTERTGVIAVTCEHWVRSYKAKISYQIVSESLHAVQILAQDDSPRQRLPAK